MHYFVDTENVGNPGLAGLERLSESDTVELFMTEKTCSFQIDTLRRIARSEAEIIFTEAVCGHPNALDFQLITKLFCTIDPDANYAIITKDKGYDAAILMAASLGYTRIRRAGSIAEALSPPPKPVKKQAPIPEEQKSDPVNAAKEHFRKKLGLNIGTSSIEFILEAARNSNTKHAFYTLFVQEYGQSEGLKRYKNVKSEYDWLTRLVK